MQYGIKQYIFVVRELTAREIKRKYSRSLLGIVWSVLQPLMFMAVMSLIFGVILPHDSNYAANYLCGYIMWAMFKSSTLTSMTAFVDNKDLFQKSKLPRSIFVLSRVYTGFVNLLLSTIAIAITLIIYRLHVHLTVLVFFVDVILTTIFTTGVSYILSTIYVFYRDIKFLWKNLTVLLVHMLAIYIPISRYPNFVVKYTKANPLFMYADIARKTIVDGMVDWIEIVHGLMWAIVSLLVGLIVFKLKENEMVKSI